MLQCCSGFWERGDCHPGFYNLPLPYGKVLRKSIMASKQPPRRRIPPAVAASVLTHSRRRCALCFHLNQDLEEKHGQIAHLDHRRANSIEDNLAWLCLKHHALYDSKASQHKNYTIEEVKVARSALYKWVKKGMPALPSRSTAKSKRKRTSVLQRKPQAKGVPWPEIVIEYTYAESSKDHHDANAPLVIRNTSTVTAYNVEVLPLETDHGTAEFDPPLIAHIEPGGVRNVFADIKRGSLLFGRRLPNLLLKTYGDKSIEELFGTKTFPLRVRYTSVDDTAFETECELLFRPWKQETKIGRTKRRTVTDGKSGSTRKRRSGDPPLPKDRPKIVPVKYERLPEGNIREALFLSNEGNPAYDIEIEPINLGAGWVLTFEQMSRLADDGALAALSSHDHENSLDLDSLWRRLWDASATSAILPLRIKYRDFGGDWYRSICELHRDVLKKSGFDVKFIRQEPMDHP